MSVILKIMGIASILLLICTIICGLWIKTHSEGNDLSFHFNLSIATVILSLLTIILFMIKK